MPQIINTNIASLNAQRNLDRSQNDANVAFQRLSSGLRINSAKDDAAGLAISTRFQSQISGLNVAQRNANDGISLAQTTEGALNEVISNLQRIRELAIQSANATNSSSDRMALDQEVQQRIAEIDRISEQTSFNGLKVLDGTFGTQTFQVGANSGDTISVNLTQGSRTDQVGSYASQQLQVTGTALTGDLTIKVGDGEAQAIPASSDGSAKSVADAIKKAGVEGLTTVSATNKQELEFTAVDASPGGGEYLLKINGETVLQRSTDSDNSFGGITAAEIERSINRAGLDGITAVIDGADIIITAEDGSDLSLTETMDGLATTAGFNLNNTAAVEHHGKLLLEADENIAIGGATDATQIGLNDGDVISVDTSKTLADTSVLTVESSNDAIERVDAALTSINGIRSELGAVQNRFESTIANLSTTSENLSAANSRIRDADFAKETAELSRTQVLQQAGMSVLSQANAQPQNVLQLLQG